MTAAGMTVGAITVAGDGTYVCVPTANGFMDPTIASSQAQSYFEQRAYNKVWSPAALLAFPLATQASVVDATTSPPTTAKGRTLQGIAADAVSDAYAQVGYQQNNAICTISTSTDLNLVVPTPNTAGTALANPSSNVILPVS